MMDAPSTTDILNELLNLELNSVPVRMIESVAFISARSRTDFVHVTNMARSARTHAGALADLIQNLGDSPRPTPPSLDSAGYHFQELAHVRALLISQQEQTVQKYQTAVQRVSKSPRAAALVGAILEDHCRTLLELSAQKSARG